MKTYDWLVVGGGITGASLACELASRGLRVLTLEKNAAPKNASLYSYGGLAYWGGTCELTRHLCQEGREIQSNLTEKLGIDNEFRDGQALFVIKSQETPQIIAASYEKFAISPQLLTTQEACEIEPLLNPHAISGALLLPQGHINGGKTTQGYLSRYQEMGGKLNFEQVGEFLCQGNTVVGVKTTKQNYYAENTVVCAGGLSRALLRASDIPTKLYFTHAEVIETPPVNFKLQTLILSANVTRLALEAEASQPNLEQKWETPGNQLVSPIIDPGIIQFQDGSLRLGQISRILSDPYSKINQGASEAKIRNSIEKLLPITANLPGTWHHCLVAFDSNSFAAVGKINNYSGIYLFSGFTNTLLLAPPLAQHFVNWVTEKEDWVMEKLCSE